MSAVEFLEEMCRMPETERRELVERIENEFAVFDDGLTPELVAELDRRAEDTLKNPGRGTPIEEVSADIRKRLLARE